jgi:DNA polymerase
MRRGVASTDLDEWRASARALLAEDVPPEQIVWSDAAGPGLLFEAPPAARAAPGPERRVPRAFVELAGYVLCHRDPARFDRLYRVLFRLTHGAPGLLDDAADPDVHALRGLEKAVERDVHRMKAFVRFVRVGAAGAPDEAFVAWYAPEHRVVRLAAPFFAERFSSMRWTILTPDESVAWDGADLRFGPGVPRHAAPGADELEDLWRTYYASIFNPARANPKAMRQHMPGRHWATMPETSIIPSLLARAPERVHEMIAGPTSASEAFLPPAPARLELPALREAARACTACELCREGTQTVFGEGPGPARLVLVGEQPGDLEDRAGRPFVGPAGQVLDDALREAGLDRSTLYVTNAVKHFHHEPRGKLRIHAKPEPRHVQACRGWLLAELASVRPEVIVCLGATAAQAFMGARFRILKSRGQVFENVHARHWLATYHPAALLRMPDPAQRARAERDFVSDLRLAADLLATG